MTFVLNRRPRIAGIRWERSSRRLRDVALSGRFRSESRSPDARSSASTIRNDSNSGFYSPHFSRAAHPNGSRSHPELHRARSYSRVSRKTAKPSFRGRQDIRKTIERARSPRASLARARIPDGKGEFSFRALFLLNFPVASFFMDDGNGATARARAKKRENVKPTGLYAHSAPTRKNSARRRSHRESRARIF